MFKNKKMMWLGIVSCLLLVPAASGCSSEGTNKADKTNEEAVAQLSEYQQNGIEAAVNSAINKEYGVGNHNYVYFSDLELTFDGDIITVKTEATVKNNGSTYKVPAEFDLEYAPSSGRYEINYFHFDDDNKGTTSSADKTEVGNADDPDFSPDLELEEKGDNNSVSSSETKTTDKENPALEGLSKSDDEFEINVGSSVTVKTKAPEGARVVTVVVDEDGNQIVVSDVDGKETEETKEIPAGKYKIVAYSSGGGWSWSFTCQ